MAKQEETLSKAERYMQLHPKLSREEAKKERRAQWMRYYDTGVVNTPEVPRQVWVNNKLKEEGF